MLKTYTTIQGDMWDAIAYKNYGTCEAVNVLIEANEKHRDTAIFSAGVVLTLPTYTKPVTSTLPPWRR